MTKFGAWYTSCLCNVTSSLGLVKKLAGISLCLFVCTWQPANADSLTATNKLSVAVPYTVSPVDPLAQTDPINSLILANISRPLVRQNSLGELSAASAWSFSISADHTEWLFAIRDDIMLSPIRPLLPEDVAKSLQLLIQDARNRLSSRARLNSDGASPVRTTTILAPKADLTTLQTLDNIRTVDLVVQPDPLNLHRASAKVRVLLKSPTPEFADVLSRLPIIDPALYETFGADRGLNTLFAAVGPYWIRENTPDGGVLMERNPAFYELPPNGAAIISIRAFVDSASALSALRTGGVEIIFLPTREIVDTAKNDATLEIISLPSGPAGILPSPKDRHPSREFWSVPGSEQDRLLSDTIIVRKGLKLDQKTMENLDFSGSYLP